MAHYTLYFYDAAKRPTGVMEFERPDDASAIDMLEIRRCGRAAELWRGNDRLLWWPADRDDA